MEWGQTFESRNLGQSAGGGPRRSASTACGARDGGFAVGTLFAGVLADAFGVETAIVAVAVLTEASGFVVAARM